MSLTDLIHTQIRQSGPISVHDYMQLCLQHPEYGYYRKARAVGKDGDFITAPEISQIFGDMIGLWLIDQWQRMGSPAQWHLVELGPGRGTLSADVLRMWGGFSRQSPVVSHQNSQHKEARQEGCASPERERSERPIAEASRPEQGQLYTPPSLHLVESNITLRELQREKLGHYHPQWHDGIETLPDDAPLVILANEFFDALPIRQWVGDTERRVASCELRGLCFEPEGAVTHEDCPAAIMIMGQLAARLQKQGGVLWIADYGYAQSPVASRQSSVVSEGTLEELRREPATTSDQVGAQPARRQEPEALSAIKQNHDTLQALKSHHYHDPLKDCGEVDLTAHVDFGALADAAAGAGLHVTGPLEQGAFLQSLGGDLWLQKLLRKTSDTAQRESLQSGWLRLISTAQMGSLFKILILHPQR